MTGLALGAAAGMFAAGPKAQTSTAAAPAQAPPPRLTGTAIVAALNTDGQPGLTAEEIDNAPAVLKALDKNADGFLTPDEVPAPARGRGAGGGRADATPTSPDELVTLMMAFDRNGDGRLTDKEVPPRFRGVFEHADTNGDKALTPDELKAYAASQAQPANAPIPAGRAVEERGSPRIDALIQAADKNVDGKLSFTELDALPALLHGFDRDGDGIVTNEEIFMTGRAQ